MMTSKDYKSIAHVIRTAKHDPACTLIEKLGDVFAADNPRFNQRRFAEACGLSVGAVPEPCAGDHIMPGETYHTSSGGVVRVLQMGRTQGPPDMRVVVVGHQIVGCLDHTATVRDLESVVGSLITGVYC